MGIGGRLKEARLNAKLTQAQLAELIGVTKGAIGNYENETSHPRDTILYKIMETLHVDANFLFQDTVPIPKAKKEIDNFEWGMIEKYRTLDEHGKDMIDMVLDKEYKRIISLNNHE